jgi:NodT family efflux transporter outer membrane factor (OMF) lipoprotein
MLAAAAGCSVGPDYEAPDVPLPAAWSQQETPGTSTAPAAAAWWKTFRDPILDSLIERAVASNHDLRIARARVREAREAEIIAASAGLPAVNASGSYSRSRTSENLSFGGSVSGGGGASANRVFGPEGEQRDLWVAGFDASWELDVFGGVRRSVEASRADLEAFEADLRDVLVTLLAEVGSSYIELRGSQRALAITRANAASQRETVLLTRARFQAGLVGELDVVRAEAQVAATESAVPALEASIAQSIHRLGVLLGEEPGALRPELLAEAPIPPPPAEVPVGLPSELLLRRPDLRRAERELASACARIGVARADLFPRFFLIGTVGLESDRFKTWGNSDSRFWSLGPNVSWPVFAGGRIRANVRVADARHEQALDRYERSVLLSLEEVENALVGYGSAQGRLRSLVQAVQSNRRAVEMSSELYTRGLLDFLAVLDAQRALFLSEGQMVESERQVSTALVALYKALGGGWEETEEEAEAEAAAGT